LIVAIEMIGLEIQETMILGLFFGTPGIAELIVIGVLAVLLFGSKLPEVARSLGSVDLLPDYSDFNADDTDEPTAPKFEAPEEED